MSDPSEFYERMRDAGVPVRYLTDRYRITKMSHPDPEPLVWVYDVTTNQLVWSSPATIAYEDLSPHP